MESTKRESNHDGLMTPMLTDLYQITMAKSYFQEGRQNQNSVFQLFFRQCPLGGNVKSIITKDHNYKIFIVKPQYLVFAGVSEVANFLQHFKFTGEDIEYLKTILKDVKPEFYEYLRTLDCSKLKVKSIPEGSLVFPRVPLMQLQGPLGLIQMLETPLLNMLSFPSLITTNASRIQKAAGKGKILLEFGLRRAQGPDGGFSASQYSYLGGFDGTSNVLAGLRYGIPVQGTMAHSFIMSHATLDQVKEFQFNGIKIKERALFHRENLFNNKLTPKGRDSELAAFLNYAKHDPHNLTCLVDTFDTVGSGVPNFISLSLAMIQGGIVPRGLRLDSGDLCELSKEARQMIIQVAQFTQVEKLLQLRISATNDLNEESILSINQQNGQIDIYGVGTNLVTCQQQPALGMVYKLVEIENLPKLKISEDAEKSTLAGKKNVFRIWKEGEAHPMADVITLVEEDIKAGTEIELGRLDGSKQVQTVQVGQVQNLFQTIWDGKLVKSVPTLEEARNLLQSQIEEFRPDVLSLKDSQQYLVTSTVKYSRFFQKCLEDLKLSDNNLN